MTDGIVNVLKPPGMTSHDVVSRIRRIYGIKKAGHSGTLDPDAAGVLPVFIGNATRLLEYAATGAKHYRAEGCSVFVRIPVMKAGKFWKQNPFRLFPRRNSKKFCNSSGEKFCRFLPCIPHRRSTEKNCMNMPEKAL